jgi:hypothetical protein
MFIGVIAFGFIEQQRWPSADLLELVVAFLVIGLVSLALIWQVNPGRRNNRVGVVMITLITLLAVAIFLEGFFRFRPNLIPRQVMNKLPLSGEYLDQSSYLFDSPIEVGRRFLPHQDIWIEGQATEIVTWNGRERFHRVDLQNISRQRIHFVTDELGFRNDPPLNAAYDVVVLGDSFSLGPEVQFPWPVLLAEENGQSVLNLAVFGLGPQAEAAALRLYGLPKSPKTVILAYFEGNDLQDAVRYEEVRAQGMSLPEYALSQTSWNRSLVILTWFRLEAGRLAQRLGLPSAQDAERPAPVPFYPLEITVNGQNLELSFLDGYVAMLTASQGDIDASENYRLAETALLEAKAMADRNGARFILVYIPSKPHVYLPLASEQQIEQLLAAIGWVHLNNGRLTIVAEGEELPATEFLERIDDQARILERLAAASNIEFLNLTPIFQEEARQGQELYLSLGTHWNEQGHQLTARTVAEYLASNNE